MKTNFWLILGTMIAAGAIAQDTNALPPIPAPVTSLAAEAAPAAGGGGVNSGGIVSWNITDLKTPAAKSVTKKKVVAPKKISEPTVTLISGPAEVGVSNLNVRGQAGLKGEFIARITKGDAVTVLDQINLAKHAADEPAQWAKIALPSSVKVWVRASFVDATNKTVLPKKLNLRAGPSEDYSVIGVIERGTPVSEVITKNDWMQIEAPTNAYAFVAAMYLSQAASGNLATNTAPSAETETPVTTNLVAEPQPIMTTEPTNTPPVADTNTVAATPAVDTNTSVATAPVPIPAVVAPSIDNSTPTAPRVVTHEGVVAYTVSPTSPTDFKLYDPDTFQNIDYLYTTAKDLDLKRYVNMRIIVTGVEGLDARWQGTPVITIQRIQVLDTNAVHQVIIKHAH
jgi:uncharacterized protein YgiM (DUF1202 family)